MLAKLVAAGIKHEQSGTSAIIQLADGRRVFWNGERQGWVYRGRWEDGTLEDFIEWFKRSGLRTAL